MIYILYEKHFFTIKKKSIKFAFVKKLVWLEKPVTLAVNLVRFETGAEFRTESKEMNDVNLMNTLGNSSLY